MNEHSARPSKQFIIRGSIALGIVIVILVVQTPWFKGLFNKKPQTAAVVDPLTVEDLINEDTNGNGIPNWEEKLWGLDPAVLYTNGTPNKELIEQKKQSLGITDTQSKEILNETDQLARQLYTLTAALGQSDEVDSEILAELGAKIGSSVDIQIKTVEYSAKDLIQTTTTVDSLQTYYTTMKRITAPYNALSTPEIDVLIQALETEDTNRIGELDGTIVLYKKIAQDLRAVTVPVAIAPYHLQMINSFAGIATSFQYIQQLSDNSVVALVGVATYKVHINRLNAALTNTANYLQTYGILSSSL